MAGDRQLLTAGITHTTYVMGGNVTLFSPGQYVLKQEISVVSSPTGTLYMAGGTAAPAGISVGGGMVEVTNIAGLAYTFDGPAQFWLGVAGGTMSVQIVKSLSAGFNRP